MPHPEMSSIEAYSQRRLSGAEMLTLGDHIAACEGCRERLKSLTLRGTATDVMPAFLGEDATLHLSQEEMVAAAGKLEGLDADARTHLSGCALCQEELAAVRQFYTPVVTLQPKSGAPRSMSAGWIVVSALAAACLALVVVPWVRRHVGAAQPVVVAELNDGSGQIALTSQGELSGEPGLPPDYVALLTQTLRSQHLPLAEGGAVAAAPAEMLRSDAPEGAGFDVLAPRGEMTLASPEFRWQALAGAKSYVVEVYDAQFKLVARSVSLTQREWVPLQPLEAGSQYHWVVKAETKHGIVQAPGPANADARFAVAPAGALASIASARQKFGGDHLLLAAVYAQAGMRRLAQGEMDVLAVKNPGSPLVRVLSDSLTDGAQLAPSKTKPAQ